MRSRRLLTLAGETLSCRDGRALPLEMEAASFRLVTRAAKRSLAILQLLDQPTQDSRFRRRQTVLLRLGIGDKHQEMTVAPNSIVDHSNPATLTSAPDRVTHLS